MARRGDKRGLKKECLNVLTYGKCIVGTVDLGENTGAEGLRWVSLCSVTAHVHAQNGSPSISCKQRDWII